jgi:hypothetical protein
MLLLLQRYQLLESAVAAQPHSLAPLKLDIEHLEQVCLRAATHKTKAFMTAHTRAVQHIVGIGGENSCASSQYVD